MRQLSITASTEPNQPGFVLEIDRRAVVALAAGNLRRARELCAESWFLEELAQYQSAGLPIWTPGAACRVRRARPEEAMELQLARVREQAEGTFEKFVFAFLIPVDLRAN
jgi:hypothetical protein